MIYLAAGSGWWVFLIIGVFAVIGIVVFLLRKYIPGLANYEKEDEEKIAKDNLDRILVDVDDEKKQEEFNKQFKKNPEEDEEKEEKSSKDDEKNS